MHGSIFDLDWLLYFSKPSLQLIFVQNIIFLVFPVMPDFN